MSAAFRAALRDALAAAAGGPLGRRIVGGTLTAIVADARGGPHDDAALAELAAALARAGVPRGRQLVLLAAAPPDGAPARERARALRAALGLAVLAHDPDGPHYVAGRLPDGAALELDDELREAEEVVLVARDGDTPGGAGAAGALWPGLGPRAAWRQVPPGAGGRRAAALAAVGLVPVDFALVWDGREPPRVRAGTPARVLAAGAGAGPDAGGPGRG